MMMDQKNSKKEKDPKQIEVIDPEVVECKCRNCKSDNCPKGKL